MLDASRAVFAYSDIAGNELAVRAQLTFTQPGPSMGARRIF